MINFKNISLVTALITTLVAFQLLFMPDHIFTGFGLTGNEEAFFIARRAAMLFIGFSLLLFLECNRPSSPSRRSLCISISCFMLLLALLGIYEYLRDYAGQGIMLAVAIELCISAAYLKLWNDDRS